MPKLPPSKLPKYCRLSQRNIAFYWKNGKRVYLPGKYNSPESLQAYREQMDLLLEERIEVKAEQKKPKRQNKKITVLEMVVEFLEWGKDYYVKNGKPTGTIRDFVLASKPLVKMYGELLVEKFVQMDLIEIQDFLVKTGISRCHINNRIGRIKRIFNWAAGRGLISHDVAGRLKFVENLQKGRTKAPELPPRQAVPDNVVDATLPLLPPVVADMVFLQRATGCRPGEIFSMTWSQIDTSDDVWIYLVNSHKTEHHGKVRIVPLNKSCQNVLERYKDTSPDDIIFSPKRTMREHAVNLAAKRKTKRQPSQVKRYNNKQVRAEYLVNEAYSKYSYRHCIQRAIRRFNKSEVKAAKEENRNPVLLPMWTPYQLRHTNASNVADVLSIEDARKLLGHSSIAVTQIYVHENIEKLKEIARKLDQN